MPKSDGIVWIDGPPSIEVDDDGALVTYRSGDRAFVHRSSHSNMRRACIAGLRELNAWEDARDAVIVPIGAAEPLWAIG